MHLFLFNTFKSFSILKLILFTLYGYQYVEIWKNIYHNPILITRTLSTQCPISFKKLIIGCIFFYLKLALRNQNYETMKLLI